MDGVLCDFVSAVLEKEGITPETFEWPLELLGSWDLADVIDISPSQMWKGTDNVEFWSELEKTPECDAIIDLALSYFEPENIGILTSPSMSPESNTGKLVWIERHFPQLRKQVVMTTAKHLCASPTTVLIDDADHNVEAFENYGGRTILVPRVWNSRYDQSTDTLYHVEYGMVDLFHVEVRSYSGEFIIHNEMAPVDWKVS